MAHNDYTGVSKIPEKYMGEFAAMNDAIHVMNTDMNETMHRIEEAASQVSAGSTNLAEGSQTLAGIYRSGRCSGRTSGILCQYHRRG